MRLALCVLAVLVVLCTACGATLTRGPAGWHEDSFDYTITPLDSGDLLPAGWALQNYTIVSGGFRRGLSQDDRTHLKITRAEDDGALYLTSYTLGDDDRQKRPEVLADRWLQRIVQSPKGDDPEVRAFAAVVPLMETTATATAAIGIQTYTVTALSGRTVAFQQRQGFTVPGGEGAELTASLSPDGTHPDRSLYLAVIKPAAGAKYAVVAYGNKPTMFDKGLADATSFAHRVHY